MLEHFKMRNVQIVQKSSKRPKAKTYVISRCQCLENPSQFSESVFRAEFVSVAGNAVTKNCEETKAHGPFRLGARAQARGSGT